ncbi:MAG: prephenate dehydrogenase dimerization domain-containing protein, partial [Phycisphaerae bacterium]
FLADTLRLRVIDISPDEHDRQMAYVQGLTHLISRAVGEMKLPDTPLATAAYERFLAMRTNLRADSWDLFVTIECENPYAKAVRDELRQTLDAIERRLG